MNVIHKALAISALAGILSAGAAAFADDHRDNHSYVRHDEWKKGYHMQRDDWARGEKVEWQHYHLRQPPHGYEWRLVDGNYVLAAVATGVVASVVVASSIH